MGYIYSDKGAYAESPYGEICMRILARILDNVFVGVTGRGPYVGSRRAKPGSSTYKENGLSLLIEWPSSTIKPRDPPRSSTMASKSIYHHAQRKHFVDSHD